MYGTSQFADGRMTVRRCVYDSPMNYVCQSGDDWYEGNYTSDNLLVRVIRHP